MKVQRIQVPRPNNGDLVNGNPKYSYLVLGDDYRQIKPVREYLKYLENAERSPATVRSYAYHLMSFFEFLDFKKIEWTGIKFLDLQDFIAWLRFPPSSPVPQVIDFRAADKPARCEKTVNAIIAAVVSFYEYHDRLGKVVMPIVNEWRMPYGGQVKYKPLLHHISKGNPQKRSLLKLKTPKTKPPVLTRDEIDRLIDCCKHLRDRLLFELLNETGMRIGQALGLRHSDVRSFDNVIRIVPRNDNVNGARAKTDTEYEIHVSADLMRLYGNYLIYEFGEIESDYVFINLWGGEIGRPMSYNAVKDLFNRLGKQTGIAVHPHIFRHTHATELLRDKWDSSYVQKRLGHKSITTTLDIYAHIDQADMKVAHEEYLERLRQRKAGNKEDAVPSAMPANESGD